MKTPIKPLTFPKTSISIHPTLLPKNPIKRNKLHFKSSQFISSIIMKFNGDFIEIGKDLLIYLFYGDAFFIFDYLWELVRDSLKKCFFCPFFTDAYETRKKVVEIRDSNYTIFLLVIRIQEGRNNRLINSCFPLFKTNLISWFQTFFFIRFFFFLYSRYAVAFYLGKFMLNRLLNRTNCRKFKVY